MSIENLTAAELEISYYISTGEFTLQESSSSLIEEQRSAFLLKQLRYEEYINDGHRKKISYMGGDGGKLCFKVVSYNVLSQQLLDQHRYLYRNQTASVLRWEYRFPRLFDQIVAEDPDIVCLQEVQESHIDSYYSRLEEIGYRSVFKKRTGGKVDGCAIYFRSCLFELLDWSGVEYFQPRVSVLNRDNVGLILRLQVGGATLVVATTHLLYNPRRHDVRLAQIQLFLAEVHRLANFSDDSGRKASVILTGDLNAWPNSPVVKLILDGSVDHDYPPLPSQLGILPSCRHDAESKLYSTQKRGESLPKIPFTEAKRSPRHESSTSHEAPRSPPPARDPLHELEQTERVSHQFNFSSVYEIGEENTLATTYQDEWVNVDYMFYSMSEDLELLSRLRLPTKEECSKFVHQLPNHASPSDHLPLAATFAIKVA